MSVEQFRRTIDVNLVGTFLFVKHFLRNINPAQRPPAIVIVGSTAGRFGEAFHADCNSPSQRITDILTPQVKVLYITDFCCP